MSDFRPVKESKRPISVLVTEDQIVELDTMSERIDISRSTLVSQMINHYLAEKRENPYHD